jgi:hypothetical protein
MRDIFHWTVVGLLIVTAFAGIVVAGEVFRAHMKFFVFLWALAPIVAVWLASKRVRSKLTLSGLKAARNVLMATVVSISFVSFANYESIRDTVGHRFVPGYYVTYVEETDDDGRPFRASVPHTDHWYTRGALWLSEIGLLGAWITFPIITWRTGSRAVNEATAALRDESVG